jgi:hypothetical protein
MESAEPHHPGERGGESDTAPEARLNLAAIESHLQLIEALLIGFGQFNTRLDQIHATLELAIGVLNPGQHTGSSDEPLSTGGQHGGRRSFRIIAHFAREDRGARLVSDVSWSDMWSIRLYITALLRNALRSGLASAECSCWCEVWSPDETGELIDSAHVAPETGVIEWESDMDAGK